MPAAKKRAKGRPSKLTPKLANDFLDAISQGMTITGAAELLGVTRETIHNWLRASKSPDASSEQAEFASRYEVARLARMDRLVEAVADGRLISGERDWKASAWLLERLHPNEFARRTIQEKVVRAELQSLIEALEPLMSREAFREMLYAIAKLHGMGRDDLDRQSSRASGEGGSLQ